MDLRLLHGPTLIKSDYAEKGKYHTIPYLPEGFHSILELGIFQYISGTYRDICKSHMSLKDATNK